MSDFYSPERVQARKEYRDKKIKENTPILEQIEKIYKEQGAEAAQKFLSEWQAQKRKKKEGTKNERIDRRSSF